MEDDEFDFFIIIIISTYIYMLIVEVNRNMKQLTKAHSFDLMAHFFSHENKMFYKYW